MKVKEFTWNRLYGPYLSLIQQIVPTVCWALLDAGKIVIKNLKFHILLYRR